MNCSQVSDTFWFESLAHIYQPQTTADVFMKHLDRILGYDYQNLIPYTPYLRVLSIILAQKDILERVKSKSNKALNKIIKSICHN